MSKIEGADVVLDFLRNLPPKIAAQIAKKALSLGVHPRPLDSQSLSGYPGYFRVDCGEFRIVYPYQKADDIARIVLVGKRNDDEIYKKLKHLLG